MTGSGRHGDGAPRERLFEVVLEHVPHPVVILDPRGDVEHSNPAFERLLGYSRDDVRTTEDWFRLAYPDPEVRRELLESWQTETAAADGATLGPRTVRATCKDGSQRDLDMVVQPLEDGRIVIVIVDATERVAATEALREEEERYRTVSDLVSDYAYCFRVEGDHELEAEWVTGALPKITGFTREELRAQGGWEALLHPDDLPVAIDQLKRLLAGESSVVEYRIVTKDGSLRWMRDFARPVREDGRTVRILGAVQDVDDLHRAEEERTRLQKQMLHLQKLESLGVLAGGIAHDFNNILVAVASYADLAIGQLGKSEPARRYLAQIKAATRRLTDLTGQMLAYSGRASFVVEPLDLSALVSDIGELLAISVSKNARLQYECAEDLPLVDGDASQLRQVVMNLILNASDALRERGGTITIRTTTAELDRTRLARTFVDDDLPAGRYVVLEVADDGPGIPADAQPRVFEPFFTTKFSGRGLGLAAVLGIVRGHRGAIDLESQLDRGARFRVFLPASQRTDAPVSRPVSSRRPQTQSWRILVVDDEASVRLVVADVLAADGHEADLAASGAEAVEAVCRDPSRYDAVLLDLTMPDMDGHECLLALHELRPGLPVILTSGYTELDARSRMGGAPLAGFLKKPFDAEALLGCLRAALD